ncbi:hypothetical protein NDU88_003187 [Pleurodeles waltl]|uniref:Uncharacterized protein n=1 Tax=Pleurodeles waltl TaxID=8319 RepID=A0AAV7UZB0_PLEWA|nr:hypothetical protein NDU88_003187 [Pleurodeles waltl]
MVDLLPCYSVGWRRSSGLRDIAFTSHRLRTQGRPQPSAASPSLALRNSNHGASPPLPTGRADDGDAVRSPLRVQASGASPRTRGEPPFSPPLRPPSPWADRVSPRRTPHRCFRPGVLRA